MSNFGMLQPTDKQSVVVIHEALEGLKRDAEITYAQSSMRRSAPFSLSMNASFAMAGDLLSSDLFVTDGQQAL